MRICAAQLKAVPGNVQENIKRHLNLVDEAVGAGCNLIVFPELSLTGYEPSLANGLAIEQGDSRLHGFQKAADENNIIICAGAPTKSKVGINISMIIFRPSEQTQVYSKEFLHADEEPFFLRGQNSLSLIAGTAIAPAICYELSVPEHAANASKNDALFYLVSVSKTADGTATAYTQLASIAKRFKMVVLMSNSTGFCDNFESAGGSAVWNEAGVLEGKLNESEEGLLVFDSNSREVDKIVC